MSCCATVRTWGLFYFAGHGMQVDGANFLIPVGTNIAAEDEVEFEAVDMGLVLGKMNTAGNVTNILIIDACRDNPFARSFRSGSRGLAVVDAPTGILIAYATAPGEVAADGTGRNGAFTEAFLDHVNTPDVDVELMFRNVRQDVMLATSNEQTPWTSSLAHAGLRVRGRRDAPYGPRRQDATPAEPEPGVADESIDAEKAIAERRLQAAYEELLGRVDQSAYDAWVRRNGYQTIAMDGSTRDKIVLLEAYLEENPRLGIVVPLRAGVLIADGIGIEIGAGIGYMISPRFGMGLGLLFGLAEGFAVGLDPHAIVMFSDTFGVRVGFQGMPEYINDFGGPSVGVIINDLLVIASIDVLGYGGFILSTGYNISF